MQDTYYLRSEVSNSDLTELKNLLYPRTQYGDKEKAFKFGSLVDAMLTEPERVRYDKHTVDDVLYSGEDWELAQAMIKSLRMEARHDPLLAQVLAKAETQRFMVNKGQRFQYGNFEYTLDTRCKWDWWLPTFGFGGDLKTTFASSQKQFDEAIDFFDWDRSRAWYMDIAGSRQDFIYGISKKNQKVFKAFIRRNDPSYRFQPSQGRGRTGGFYFGRNHPRPFVQRIAGSRTRCHRQSGESVGTAFHLHQ